MKYRRFGKTEIEMPVITCGGMRFQQGWGDVSPADIAAENQANLEKIVRHALELGINHFETARGYGSSEYQLGKILPQLPRNKIIVQTKNKPELSEDEFLKNFDISIRNLNLDYLDLLAIHGINNREILDITLKNGTLSACRKLKEQGIIKHIGFSTHAGPETIIEALRTDEFSFVNLHWYYIDQRNRAAIQEAAKRDIGVFIISPNDKGGQLFKPPVKLSEFCAPFSPMEFNDLFCLCNKEIHTLSIGAARPSDLDAHAGIINRLDENTATLIKPVTERLNAEFISILGADWMKNWYKYLPAPEDAEDQVCLYHILRLYNLVKTFDMIEFSKFRYNLLGNGGHWFPGRKATEEALRNIDSLLTGNPRADKIKNILRETHILLNDAPQERLSQSA